MTAISQKVMELYPSQVRVRKDFNVRKDMGDMTGLQKSIQQNGIRLPLLVIKTKDKTDDGYPIYELVDGHRRFTAAFKLSINKPEDEAVMIPAQEIDKNASEFELTKEMLVRGVDQKALNMLEQAKAIKRLMEAEVPEGEKPYREADVAREIGKSHTYVADCLLLLTATKDVQKQVENGSLSATAAIELIKANPVEEVEEMVTAAKKATGKKKVTVKDVAATAGKPVTKKGSKGGSSTSTKKGADEVSNKKTATTYGKNDNAVQELEGFLESLRDQEGELTAKENALEALEATILLLKGKKLPIELIGYFFNDAPAAKKTPAPKKSAAKLPQDDEPEEEVPAPKRKSLRDVMNEVDEEEENPKATKKAATKKPAVKKPAPAKKTVVEDDEELEDLTDDDLLDDDDDIV